MSTIKMSARALALGLLATATAQTITTTAGPSIKSSSTEMRLAKKYQGYDFFNNFDFETANDPTGGYVNYVSQDYAQSQGLISVEGDGSVLIRADSSKPGQGRGRDSVRLASKDEFADGVYILDVNHMPVGCGVWPAWWTTVKSGWPKGGEIDIIEGANALPKEGGTAWKATGNITTPQAMTSRNVASLHTADTCNADSGTYMTGTLESPTCSAYMNGNQGCGVQMGGNTTYGVESFGSQVNDINGGWYALWRDMEASGGAYVWFWPRNSPNVPDDVRNPSTTSTNVNGWGQPAANLTTGCRSDFSNHVIVFNIAFCGDYSAATYGISGCPITQNCPTFVQANPQAFTETYWSINSLRVYNAQGKPVSAGSGLSKGAIAGIVVGVVAAIVIIGLVFWRYRSSKRRRLGLDPTEEPDKDVGFTTGWAGPDDGVPKKAQKIAPLLSLRKPRVGPTNLAPGKTARHQLDGETSANFYHEVADDLDYTPRTSDVAMDEMSRRGSAAPSIKKQPRSTVQPRNAPAPSNRYSVSQPSPANSSFAQMASGRRGSAFNGEGNKGWVG